jgi:hypothetical protein
MTERRRRPEPPPGGRERRRGEPFDYPSARERYELARAKAVTLLAAVCLLAITVAVIVTDIGDNTVVAALIATFGALLGLPAAIRVDLARRNEGPE